MQFKPTVFKGQLYQVPCLFYIFHDSNISLLSFSYADKIISTEQLSSEIQIINICI